MLPTAAPVLLLAAALALSACSRPGGGAPPRGRSPRPPRRPRGRPRRGRRGERRVHPGPRARAAGVRTAGAPAAGGARHPPAGARGADRRAPGRRGGRKARRRPRGAPAPRGGRPGRGAAAGAARGHLRAEQGPLRRPAPRRGDRPHPGGPGRARAGRAARGLREGAARRGEGDGPARGPPRRGRDPAGVPLPRAGRRPGDDRGVHRLPVPLLPPGPGRDRRAVLALPGEGAPGAPRLPARRAPGALPAARAVRCATEQGRFWEYHRGLMLAPGRLDEADLLGRARGLRPGRGRLRRLPVVRAPRRRHRGVAPPGRGARGDRDAGLLRERPHALRRPPPRALRRLPAGDRRERVQGRLPGRVPDQGQPAAPRGRGDRPYGAPHRIGLEAAPSRSCWSALAVLDTPARCSSATATRTAPTSRRRCWPSAWAARGSS
jgi:hypothetical protein